jgi:predicted MFS family arabinose efflux permease
LIADYYPRDRRASAISIYSLGNPLGIFAGAVAAGWIAQEYHWRLAFFLLGAPGLLLALLVLVFLREPARGASDGAAVEAASAAGPAPSLADVLRRMRSKPALLHMVVGLALGSFIAYGSHAFLHPYLVRTFHMGYAQAATVFGTIIGISAMVGTAAGGFLSDWTAKYDKRWYAWIPAIGLALSGPLTILALTQHTWQAAVAILILPSILSNTYVATTFGSCHNMMEPRMRASALALVLFVSNLVGGGLGPLVIGFLSDQFATHAFTLGDFAAACPGGAATAGAAPELATACTLASAVGVRDAIIVAAFLYLWAGLHYLLAGRTIRRDLEA